MHPVRCLPSLCFKTVTQVLSLPTLSDPCSLVAFFTVNSKAEVRFHLASADWIAEPVRQKMAVMVTAAPLLIIPQWLLAFAP